MHIAEAALAAPLPAGWQEGEEAGHRFYWQQDRPAQWEHPADAEFRRQLLEARAAARAEGAAESAPGLDVGGPGVARPVAGEADVEDMAVY
eukprot:SAG31_NODE_28611_length_407_cov_1.500000_1_plen_90_part_10